MKLFQEQGQDQGPVWVTQYSCLFEELCPSQMAVLDQAAALQPCSPCVFHSVRTAIHPGSSWVKSNMILYLRTLYSCASDLNQNCASSLNLRFSLQLKYFFFFFSFFSVM